MSYGWPDFWTKTKYTEIVEQVKQTLIINGDFETGDLTGWKIKYGDQGTVTVTSEHKYFGNYSAKFVAPETIGTTIIEIRQPVNVRCKNVDFIRLYVACKEGDGQFWLGVRYDDVTKDDFYLDLSTPNAFYALVVNGDDLPQGKRIEMIAFGPSLASKNAGKTFYVDLVGIALRNYYVYQAEKDRTITREGNIQHFTVAFSAAGSVAIYTPSSGKKAKVLGFLFYTDSDVIAELRFQGSRNVIAAIPSKGSIAMNLVGMETPVGDTDEKIELYASGACTIKGWICVEEV